MKGLALLGLLRIAALQAQNTIAIEGMVVNAGTGAGIGGATVFAAGHMLLTDGAGVFRVAGVKPGDYSGYAQKQGYLELVQFRFHVNADGSPVRLRVELVPPATLRGRVVGTDGKPVRASVDLGPGPRRSVITNDDGYFTFDKLPPDAYILLARPETAEPVPTAEGVRTALVPSYYPSTRERVQAESIIVRPGADLSDYEIRLQTAPVYRVGGVVLDLDGNPAHDALVQLFDNVSVELPASYGGGGVFSIKRSSFADTSNTTQSTSTADDGTFEFPSVWPGDWIVRVESDSVRDEIHQRDVVLFGSETLSLGSKDLDDVKIRLRMPFDLSGDIEGADGYVLVTLGGETGFSGGSARPDVNGVVRLEGIIPGSYLISVQANGNYYASVFLGSSEVTGQTVELTASTPPMRVVLKKGGTIHWTQEQSGSWTVVLFPRTLSGAGYSVSSQISQLTGIPPGEYYAIALDTFNTNTMADAPHLGDLVSRATSVRVESGSDTFVQLKINRAPD